MSNAKDQSSRCWTCKSTGVHGDSDSAGTEVWCGCIFSYCGEMAYMDVGRGDETHVCHLRPGHEGAVGLRDEEVRGEPVDHNDNGVTWAVSESSPIGKPLP